MVGKFFVYTIIKKAKDQRIVQGLNRNGGDIVLSIFTIGEMPLWLGLLMGLFVYIAILNVIDLLFWIAHHFSSANKNKKINPCDHCRYTEIRIIKNRLEVFCKFDSSMDKTIKDCPRFK